MMPLHPTMQRMAEGFGFDAVRSASVDAHWLAGERLSEFVANERHGEMAWMETTLTRRMHPKAMWPDARSAVVVALNYAPSDDPLDALTQKQTGVISVYARGSDYHDVLKKKLRAFAMEFARTTGAAVKIFVDTAPLMEKPLAALAGLGWQGKHTNLVSRDFGSWLFLGVMLTDAVLEPDAPETDHCGSCRACLDICPTNAFPAPYQLDARRCISYLTIELKGPIPREHRRAIGNRIFGCDDCLAVCPWNKFAAKAQEQLLHARPEHVRPDLADLATLDDSAFRDVFAGSPVKRIGRDRFMRNVMVAIGNSGATGLVETCMRALDDASPLVRGAAVWALGELAPAEFAVQRAVRAPREADVAVREEWDAGRDFGPPAS